MHSPREYRTIAAECTRLAQIAPSERGKASFAAAANYWMMHARLAGTDGTAVGGSAPIDEPSPSARQLVWSSLRTSGFA
jgi:hypothetical protein